MQTSAALRPQILVVEDEWLIAEYLSALLDDFGFTVIGPAGCVAEALELIATAAPDAALLDVTLGRDRSFPIAERLSDDGVPFAFLTGHTRLDLPDRFGNCTILGKPVSADTLRSALTALTVAA
jgi:DNA-binding response OmpR family regulator